MKYLTFLDYKTLEITGKNLESKLQEKDIGDTKRLEKNTIQIFNCLRTRYRICSNY